MASNDYATVQDVQTLWRPLTAAEQTRAASLIPVICSSLRTEAAKVHKDLDAMVAASADLAEVARSVTVDVVARTLMTSTNQEPMTQYSQAVSAVLSLFRAAVCLSKKQSWPGLD